VQGNNGQPQYPAPLLGSLGNFSRPSKRSHQRVHAAGLPGGHDGSSKFGTDVAECGMAARAGMTASEGMRVAVQSQTIPLCNSDSRARSFRRGAEALNLKQSTLSHSIRLMEQRVGIVLFERTRIGVCSIVAGTESLCSTCRIIDRTRRMKTSACTIVRSKAGRLTAGFYAPLSIGNLRAMLLGYLQSFPKFELGY